MPGNICSTPPQHLHPFATLTSRLQKELHEQAGVRRHEVSGRDGKEHELAHSRDRSAVIERAEIDALVLICLNSNELRMSNRRHLHSQTV